MCRAQTGARWISPTSEGIWAGLFLLECSGPARKPLNICGKSCYAHNMQVYTGKPPGGPPERNQRVVLQMTEGLKGHTITVDSFFTSYSLGQELLWCRLTMVGTVRRNKPELHCWRSERGLATPLCLHSRAHVVSCPSAQGSGSL